MIKETKLTKEIKMKNKVKVLITTDSTKRGVFSCIINDVDRALENIEAEDIRMIVQWTSDVKGIIGLASNGPSKSCRVSPAVKKGLLKGVVGVFELTDAAYKKFESEPWG